MGNESNQLHVFVQEMAILPRVGEFTTPSGYHSGNDSMIWRRGEERRGEERRGEERRGSTEEGRETTPGRL